MRIAFRLLWLLVTATTCGQEPPRKNVVFLLADDQRADTLGITGNVFAHTPHLDALGRDGVVFDEAFVTTSICMTSRASILTGQYAARHGIVRFNRPLSPAQLARTYPALLKDAGYRTGFIGKWGVARPPRGLFDFNRGFGGQGWYYDKKRPDRPHLTRHMGDQALEFIDAQTTDRPFCLSVSFKAPHVQDQWRHDPFPHDKDLDALFANVRFPRPRLGDARWFAALPPFLRTSESRARWQHRFKTPALYQRSMKGYATLIAGIDRVVGRIRARLKARGLADDTVIVFTSDHGFYLGERGLAGKWFAHEESIRVPMIVFDPGAPESARGARRSEIVLNLDVAPTLLAAAGVSAPRTMQGKSLWPLVRGRRPDGWRTSFFYEHHFKHRRIPRSEAVRTRRHKYIRYLDEEPLHEEVYDLTADPGETRNLATPPEHAALLARMRGSWEAHRRDAR